MKRSLLSKLSFGILGSSSSSTQDIEEVNIEDLDQDWQEFARIVAAEQAAGLDGATVIVHSVTERMEFYDATPHDNQKLLVVDVTFIDHKGGFGLAGVELIDGEHAHAESLGGGAYKVYLEEDGTLMKDQSGLHLCGPIDSEYEKPIRVFLVYSVRKNVKKIGLGYWGRVIVDRPYDVLPEPVTTTE